MIEKTDNKEIDKLILKLINNTISEFESKDLVNWLECPDNLKYFNDYIKINQLINSKREFDYEYSLRQFIEKAHNKNRFAKRVLYIAASIVVFISIGVFTTVTIQNKISNRNWERLVVKSKNTDSVKLITDSGKEIVLSDEGDRILHVDGEELEESGDSIVYKNRQETHDIHYNQLLVPKGKIYTIILADGTVATINSDSKIRFATDFVGLTRDVWVEGEVYFKVAHNKSKPFIVHTDNFDTKVLGTEFNLRAYKDESKEMVTLVNGSVQLLQNQETKILTPEHQFIYPVKLGFKESEIKEVDIYMYVSWINGIMYFEDQKLEDIMIRLSKWYSFEYEFKDKSLKNKRYTGGVRKSDDLRKIFKMLNNVNDAQFSVKDDRILIE